MKKQRNDWMHTYRSRTRRTVLSRKQCSYTGFAPGDMTLVRSHPLGMDFVRSEPGHERRLACIQHGVSDVRS